MDGHRDPLNPPAAPAAAPMWWWLALGGALVALAGRLWLIRHCGTELPFRDEWKAVAEDVIAPWLAGRLGWREFFAPVNDHCLVLTRALAFALLRLNGQWNNLLETTVNALILVPPLALVLRTVGPALGRWPALAWALFTGTLLALPVTGENTLWGIQSLVFFQVALSIVYLWAVATRERCDRLWWAGQLLGGLALLTQQSAVLAPVVAVLFLGWRLGRDPATRRTSLAGLAFAGLWIAGYFRLAPDFTVTADMRADSWRLALDLCLRQLAWPLPHPGWAFLLWAPWLWFAAERLRQRRLSAVDALLLVLALWVGAQAAAIGYGRGGETTGFVSRYCDFLLYGVSLNAACIFRLWQGHRRSARLAVGLLGAAWLVALAPGLRFETLHSHAGYILARRPAINANNLAAVRDYLATGDLAALSRERTGDFLHHYPPGLAALLDDPRFRALLPPATGAPEARPDDGRIGRLGRVLPAAWPGALALGLFALAFAAWKIPPGQPGPEQSAPPWAPRDAAGAALLLGLAAGAALLAWPSPLTFDPAARWTAAFEPARTDVALLDPVFTRRSAGPDLAARATIGAVTLARPIPARLWHGTRLPDNGFTGTLASEPAPLRHRFLVTPYTGWPNWPGNGLRWRFRNPETGEERWIEYMGGNPSREFDLWVADASDHVGWEASLFLFDGLTDRQGWLGVARPAATDHPAFARIWRATLKGERAEATHRILAASAAAAFAAAAVLAVLARRQTKRRR